MKQKVIVFGAGKIFEYEGKKIFKKYDVIAFTDNNPKKANTYFYNKLIIKPTEIGNYDYDYVVIVVSEKFKKQIFNQLIKLGINKEKIIMSYTKNIYVLGTIVDGDRTIGFIDEIINNTNHRIHYNSFLSGMSGIKKIINYFSNIFAIYCSDIIYVVPMCQPIYFKYIRIAKLLKKRILTEFYISDYDTIVNDIKMVLPNTKEADKLKEKDKFLMNISDTLIFLTKEEVERYTKIVNVNLNEINYTIINLFKSHKPKVLLKYLNNNRDSLNICWWGGISTLHGLEKIIEAIKLLNKKNFRCNLYIFGSYSLSSEKSYEELKNLYDIPPNVYFNNEYTMSNGKLDEFLVKECDLALGLFGDSMKARNVIANKIIDAISFKVPIITGNAEPLKKYFNGKTDIYTINSNSEELASKIMEVATMDRKEVLKNIENAYSIYIEHFSKESSAEKFISLIEEI